MTIEFVIVWPFMQKEPFSNVFRNSENNQKLKHTFQINLEDVHCPGICLIWSHCSTGQKQSVQTFIPPDQVIWNATPCSCLTFNANTMLTKYCELMNYIWRTIEFYVSSVVLISEARNWIDVCLHDIIIYLSTHCQFASLPYSFHYRLSHPKPSDFILVFLRRM